MRTPHLTVTRTRLLLVGAALALLAGCSSSSSTKTMSDEQKLGYYLENALRYYDLRDLPRAINQAQRGLEVEPRNERLLLIQGRCHLQLDTREGILTAEKILRNHPNQKDYRVRMTLGEALERKGILYDIAAREVAAGDRYTDEADPEAAAADLHDKAIESWEEAITHFEASNKYFRGGIESLNGLMRVQTFLLREDEALETAKILVQAIAESSQLLRMRLREQENSENDTWPVQRQILGNDDLITGVHLHMSEIYKARGNTMEALAQLDLILAVNPEMAEVYSRRGMLFLELGDPQRARAAIGHFVAKSTLPYEHPDILKAHELLHECDKQLEALDRAARIGDVVNGG